MRLQLLTILSAVAVTACSDSRARETAVADTLSRSTQAGRADFPSPGLEPVGPLTPVRDSADAVTLPRASTGADAPRARKRARPHVRRAAARRAEPSTRPSDPAPANPSPADSAPKSSAAVAIADRETPADTVTRPAAASSDADGTTATAPDTNPSPDPAPSNAAEGAAVAPVAANPEPSDVAAARTLPAGTRVSAALSQGINSRRDKAGKRLSAQVMDNLTDARGRLVLPAGSLVHMTVTELAPARSRGAHDGKLAIRIDSVDVNGVGQRLSGSVEGVSHELRGRGVTAGEVEKVGAGAAVGAVAGRVIGGNTKGAVIGGVVGAAGGAAVAHQTASRDVVVKPRTPVVFVLTEPFTAPPR